MLLHVAIWLYMYVEVMTFRLQHSLHWLKRFSSVYYLCITCNSWKILLSCYFPEALAKIPPVRFVSAGSVTIYSKNTRRSCSLVCEMSFTRTPSNSLAEYSRIWLLHGNQCYQHVIFWSRWYGLKALWKMKTLTPMLKRSNKFRIRGIDGAGCILNRFCGWITQKCKHLVFTWQW